MDDSEFDRKLVTAALALAAETGWGGLSVVRAAQEAGLPLEQARARFPGRGAVVLKFNRFADQAALATLNAIPSDSSARDRLFDLLMQRIEFLQTHRDGVLALLRALPTDPGLALLLAAASGRSMNWMLQGAGIDSTGLAGGLRTHGVMAVWLWTLRAWQRDETEDLATTMTALDRALTRAEQADGWLHRGRRPAPEAAPEPEPDLPVALPEMPPDSSPTGV